MLTVSIKETTELVILALKANLVAMLHGSPAIGKSDAIKQIARQFKLKLIDLRLSQCEPTDLSGLPFFKDGRASYNAFDTFPLEGDEVPVGYNGWLLFLDEMNSAMEQTQAAAYRLILDREVGTKALHPSVYIVCAGNKSTDGAIVNEMSTAMQSRLVHLNVQASPEEFLRYAETKGFDQRIVDYLHMRPDCVYNFKPGHSDKTYASPRTWEFMDRFLKALGSAAVERKHLPLMAGIVGEGVGREFYTFTQINPPKFTSVMADPKGFPLPDNRSVLFALTGACAIHFEEDTSDKIMEFVNRLDPELQILTVRRIVRRNIKHLALPALASWKERLASELV